MFSVLGFTKATIQADIATGTYSAAVLTIERSNNGTNWYGLESATTMTPPAMSAALDVSGFAYIRVRTSTANGAALTLKLNVCCKSIA